MMGTLHSIKSETVGMVEFLYEYYFTKGMSVKESPIIHASIAIPVVIGFLGFLLSAFIPFELTLVACFGVFGAFVVLHFSLWVFGSIYAHGFVNCMKMSAMFIGGLTMLAIVIAIVLFGWVGVSIAAMPIVTMLPNYLNPLIIVVFVVFAFGWYAKGLEYLEGI